MTLPADTEIAGKKTVADWQALKPTLVGSTAAALWQSAYDDYFHTRLKTRYFDPIEVLFRNRQYRGEGFAIVAIQCSLVEFLAATLEGVLYRHAPSNKLALHEYNNSGDMFASFLAGEAPFKSYFSHAQAQEFYSDVRCALLHEARTRNGWRIRAAQKSGVAVDVSEKIICPFYLQRLFQEYSRSYRGRLVNERALQEAFIRKFDSLCQ
jgi:hypothetical protein